jgi:hypothetical protein
VRHRREAALLLSKAQASMRRMARIFNDLDEDGRKTSVLLHLQHAFEMLLKAGLVQEGQAVFEKRMGRSIGFETCVNRSREHLNVTGEEAGLLKAIDALRDEAQHWLTDVPEAILYAHCRGAITLYDRILEQTFQQRLADSLPSRVLPLSTEPPRDIQMLIDDQYSQVQSLLQPGKRRGAEARAGIRTLLALEAHVALEEDDGPRVSEKDVDRVELAVRDAQDRDQVFPRLKTLGTEVTGEGIEVKVRFVKSGGMPVTYVDAEDDGDAAALREFDLQRRYHWGFHLWPRNSASALRPRRPSGGSWALRVTPSTTTCSSLGAQSTRSSVTTRSG